MKIPPHRATREEEALAEIAATRVSTGGGWAFVLALLAILLIGPAIEGARHLRGEPTAFARGTPIPTPREMIERWRTAGPLAAHAELRAALLGLEDRLGRESALSAALRPSAQTFLARQLGYGNTQVLVGREGWLFFRTSIDYLAGPPFLAPRELARRRTRGARYEASEPDPVPGLVQLRDELAARGIELVFFPVPVKAEVHPEKFLRASGLPSPESATDVGSPPPANSSFRDLVRRLEAAGVLIYDALPDLRAAAVAGDSLYLATDTHWNAAGMRVAAAGLARFLERETALPVRPPAGFRRRGFAHSFEGDLTRLLDAGSGIFPDEALELDEVVGLRDVPYRVADALQRSSETGDAGAPLPEILLLGDSYSLVFSSAAGRSASFAEQLAFALDRPIRRSAKVATNDLADRVSWLRQDPGMLEGTRVVVYEVTARALSSADWSGARIQPQDEKRRNP